MLLKLNLVLILILFASVFNASGQTASQLARPSDNEVKVNNITTSAYQDAVLNEYSITTHESTPQSRPMVSTFDCDEGLVFIIANTASANGNVSGLYSFNLGTKTQSVVKDPLVESTTTSQFINGIGYNIKDNFIYGLLQRTNQVVKIDATGATEYLTVKGNFEIGDYSSGDVDKNGFLYLYGKGKFVSIDLNPDSANYLMAQTLLTYGTTVHDFAFSPVDDNMYMMTSNSSRSLLRYNTATNTITDLGRISGLTSESTSSFGTAFMDSKGNMYVSNNASGKIYKIESPHTGNLKATFYNSLAGIPGDGARCPNQVAPPNAEDDQACVQLGETFTIDLLQNDGSGTYPIDVTSVKLIDPATEAEVSSVTIAGQGTFEVNNSGILTFTPAETFSDASLQYKITDTAGMYSNLATINVGVNNTAIPSGPSVQNFCQIDGLTLADLNVTGTSIKWYGSESGTKTLPVTTALAQNTTYYATQTSAASCESLERLAVTVEIKDETVLMAPETVACVNKRTAYVIEATFKGIGSFTVTGTGAPGTFITNGNDTTTWKSSPVNASELSYEVEVAAADGCNSITLSGDAPVDCLAGSFHCEDGLAFILTNTGTDQSNYVTGLYTLNLTTNVQQLVKYPLVEDTTSSQFINAIGYNTLDNYLYGLLQQTNKIAQIDNAGDIEYFEITGAFTPGFYSSGDIDPDGIMYLYNGSKFVSINLDPTSPVYLEAIDLISFSASVNDLAYSPVDFNLYMVTSTGTPRLLRYDLAANVVTNLGTIVGLASETTSSFGTAFMDSIGNLLIANNSSGNIYQIASPHLGNVTATFYSGAMEGLQPGDGARCPNEITFPVANDDSVCGFNDSDTVIDVTKNDGRGSYALDKSSVKFIDPVTSESATSVDIAGQGTFTVDSTGVVTFSPVPEFTEASVNYTIMDVIGSLSQPATVRVYLGEFIVDCPTFEDTAVECYADLPSQTSYSIEEFEALGGTIGDDSCGIIQIAASNSADNGSCSQTVTRTYTITEYKDTNNNGILDADETTVLNTVECVQLITVEDLTAPNLVTEYETEYTITCDNIPPVPSLVFEDECTDNINVVFTETSTGAEGVENYVITRTWKVSDTCGNEEEYTQTINVNTANAVVGTDTELCNDDDIDFDLFSLLSGNYDSDGTWTVVTGNATLDGSIFNPYQLALTTYTFKYTVEDEFCPTETLVNISLNDDCVQLSCGAEDVVISKAVTTYADGKNDFFTITGVETCGFTYEVQIFNRWGAMVYESNNYQNDWNGAASKASIGNSNYVPTGTYYYVVNLKNSGLKPFSGPIYVATK